jgi:hypothetical protein
MLARSESRSMGHAGGSGLNEKLGNKTELTDSLSSEIFENLKNSSY